MENLTKTARTTVKRAPKRGIYDKKILYKILDAAFICHVGFIDNHYPVVIPMACWRINNCFYIHAATNSRLAKQLRTDSDVCATVTILDELVLAKSAFHHSMNYRSAMIFGPMMEVKDAKAMNIILQAFMEHVQPGRWQKVRLPNKKELNLTSVFALNLDEASVKIRSGGPVDDKKDLQRDVWAGTVAIPTKD